MVFHSLSTVCRMQKLEKAPLGKTLILGTDLKLILVDVQAIIEIKALLGVLARLPWGRRDMLGLMDGKHGGVYVECVSLMVSCYWIKVFITA